jgi:hypothetical protein
VGLVDALKRVDELQSREALNVAPPTEFVPTDDEREDTPESPASDSEKSLEQARADIKRMKAELSVQRKKIRAGGKLLKHLMQVHKVQLEVDPHTWEPVSSPPV